MTARHRCSAQNERKCSGTKRRESELSCPRRERDVKSSALCSWWALGRHHCTCIFTSHARTHARLPTLAITKPRGKYMRHRPLHHACKNSNYVCKMWYRMNLPEPGGVRCSKCAAVGQPELSRPECQLHEDQWCRPDPEAKGHTPI
jgi:hypothetical protein